MGNMDNLINFTVLNVQIYTEINIPMKICMCNNSYMFDAPS